MPRAEREQQMLDVAEEIFAERGYRAVSMTDIAERVGVSKPMLYEYFGSKEGLLLAVMARAKAELREVTERAVAGAVSAEDAMRRGYRAYFEFNEAHRPGWMVLLAEPAALSLQAIEEMRRQQTDLIVSMMAGVVLDRPRQALAAYAEIIVGACERLALWRARNPEVTAGEAAGYLMDLTWEGIRAR